MKHDRHSAPSIIANTNHSLLADTFAADPRVPGQLAPPCAAQAPASPCPPWDCSGSETTWTRARAPAGPDASRHAGPAEARPVAAAAAGKPWWAVPEWVSRPPILQGVGPWQERPGVSHSVSEFGPLPAGGPPCRLLLLAETQSYAMVIVKICSSLYSVVGESPESRVALPCTLSRCVPASQPFLAPGVG